MTCTGVAGRARNFIIPVHNLPYGRYPPCKYEGMDMYSIATVVSQIWLKYGNCRSITPILRGVHVTAITLKVL